MFKNIKQSGTIKNSIQNEKQYPNPRLLASITINYEQ